jgi:8-oxo-dGTP diphosphatase
MEGTRFIVNVEGAVVRDGRYLVIVRGQSVRHAPGVLTFPGGKMEVDAGLDAVEATVRRELREEVAVEVGPEVVYVESHIFEIEGVAVLDVVVLCRWASGEPFPAAPDEVAAVEWRTADELLADPGTPPWTAASLRRAEALRVARGW